MNFLHSDGVIVENSRLKGKDGRLEKGEDFVHLEELCSLSSRHSTLQAAAAFR
jgi:hypothetical protein